MKQNGRGFTIVELLIVIVVIAILAAVTIVAFNNFTQRAENAKTQQAVAAYTKLIHLYTSDNGSYPNVSSCLGNQSCLSSTTAVCFGAGAASSTTLNTYISTYMNGSTYPQPSTQKLACGGATYSGAYYYYDATNKMGKFIVMYGGAPTICPPIGGATASSVTTVESASRCIYSMPAVG